MHVSENLLHSYLDHETSEEESNDVQKHLRNCNICREEFARIQKRAEANRQRLDVLLPAEEPADDATLLRRFQERQSDSAMRKSKWKPAWAAGIAIAVLITGISFKPVRVWATEFLSLFRVQQIAVVQIDPANLQALEGGLFGQDSERRIEQLLSDDARVVKHGVPQVVPTANDAARLAGFGIRMPGVLKTSSKIHVHPAVDLSFSIDVERLQAIFDDAGRSDIRIPSDLDGEMIRVNIASSVTAFFGECPDIPLEETDSQKGLQRASYPECKILAQLPTPVIVAPPSLNIAQLGIEMLKLFGFTDEQARKFSESIDWATTLVVPFPMDHRMDVKEVDVDGVKGNLFASHEFGPEEPPAYNLLWIRDGILYSLMGRGTVEEALAIANSL